MSRRRDPELDARILAATQELMAAPDGAEVTIEAVAARAGVSRPTVYRRWPTRAALLFAAQTNASVTVSFPDLGSARADLVAAVSHLAATMAESDRRILGQQFAQMVIDEEFARRVWEDRWIPDRHVVLEIWKRGVDRGEIAAAADGASAIDDIVAICMFRVLFGHSVLTVGEVEAVVDRALAAVRPEGRRPGQP